MTVPSTEELQRILDEAKKTGALPLSLQRGSGCVLPNGEYEHGKLFDNDGWEVGEGIGNALGELFLVAPYLAAEVIRLREENERLTRIEWLAEQAAESDSGLAYDLDQINREYEGDQP